MHRLNRSDVPVPSCLLSPNGRKYGNLSGAERAEIRSRLLELQKHRCAYCERGTGDGPRDGHIEHFRQQANNLHLAMDWDNMYWSCSDENTCGKHKDNCKQFSGHLASYQADDLIDPGKEDPDAFFLFVSDGSLRPRDGLDATRRRRAEVTIRVFQLADSPFLRRWRKKAIQTHLAAIQSLTQYGADCVVTYLIGQMEEIQSAPFSSAIRQNVQEFMRD